MAIEPTAQDQYMLELLNRARSSPQAEADRLLGGNLNEGLTAGTISTAAKQPLAFNLQLFQAAEGHSRWMLSSGIFDHTGNGGSSPGVRVTAAGYPWSRVGENLAWQGTTGTPDWTGFVGQQHDDLFVDSGIAGRGHRVTMMNGNFREIGISSVVGKFTVNGTTYNSVMTTQDFGRDNHPHPFLTGVVFTDRVKDDNFYTVGEGLGKITITAVGNGQTFSTETMSAGGYSLRLAQGNYQVTFTGDFDGDGKKDTTTPRTVTIGDENVKLDFATDTYSAPVIPPAAPTEPPPAVPTTVESTPIAPPATAVKTTSSPTPIDSPAPKAVASVLPNQPTEGDDVLTGSTGSDTIRAKGGNDRVSGLGGNDTLRGEAGNDYLHGGQGNDILDGGIGADTLDGGTGADRMIGGKGNDIYVVDHVGDVVIETSTLKSEIDTVQSSISYSLVLNVEKLTLAGSKAINGRGNSLNNTIEGNSAANILYGSAGNDVLTGGLGADKFQFLRRGEGIDRITDFTSAQGDKIVISAAGFGGGLLAGSAILASQLRVTASGASTTTSSQRLIYNSNSGGLFFDVDGVGGQSAVQFATLAPNLPLSASDFMVI
jgi:Ca2+-binding RTX toxin-like protein